MRDTSLAETATRWYGGNARDLPWRAADVTPWGVLVSEVMLQQTQVARVEPAWHAWMRRWPTPAMLAADPPAEAIRAWGRLGYPRRALRLHGCASAIVERHRGEVPDDLDALLTLPGIGAYTARAVAAFAFRQRHPVVDTNVRRVVARILSGTEGGATTTSGDLATVEALLPDEPEAAARASVAFMELGAVVCTARAPRCADCPLRTACSWRRAGGATGGATGARAGGATGARTGIQVRRTQRYAGTDRQVRGLLLAVLREAPGTVPRERLDLVWTDAPQRARALASLVEDGLVRAVDDGYLLGNG